MSGIKGMRTGTNRTCEHCGELVRTHRVCQRCEILVHEQEPFAVCSWCAEEDFRRRVEGSPRLCEASGWCQSADTAWNSDAGKWLCRTCEDWLGQA